MNNDEVLKKLAQEVNLLVSGSMLDTEDLTGEEGDKQINEIITWTNLFFSEFELETDWQFLRRNQAEIGQVNGVSNIQNITHPYFRKLVATPYRRVFLRFDDTIIGEFEFVEPNLINETFSEEQGRGRVSIVNNKLVFSRPFTEYEKNAKITADIMLHLVPVSRSDTSSLDLIQPRRLLIYGIAKDKSLPDIVSGVISPSLVQRYQDLLSKAVAENEKSSLNADIYREDFSRIRGVY